MEFPLRLLYDTWVEEVEEGKMAGVLLCDRSAAFGLCDHYLLVEKMKLMGVEEDLATRFWSYLSGRRQSTAHPHLVLCTIPVPLLTLALILFMLCPSLDITGPRYFSISISSIIS